MTTIQQSNAVRRRLTLRSGAFLRILGVGFGVAVGFGNTVGTGILTGPRTVAQELGSMLLIVAAWAAVGIYALLAATSLSELGAMMPRAGAYYVYAKRAYGGFPAFLVGWTDWLVSCGGLAAAAVAFGMSLQTLVPGVRRGSVFIAAALIILFVVVQLIGVRAGVRVQSALSAVTGVMFVTLVAACFTAPPGDPVAIETPAASRPMAAAVAAALLPVFFAYDGWCAVLYFGDEIRNPGRDVPRSMFLSVLIIMTLYVLVNVALIRVLTVPGLAVTSEPVVTAASSVFGPIGQRLAGAAVLIVYASIASSCLLIASRIIAGLGSHGDLPNAFARVVSTGTPVPALALTATAAVVIAVNERRLERVIEIVGVFIVVADTLMLAAVPVLRRRDTDAARPYRAWGYPWTTVIALTISVGVISLTAWSNGELACKALLCLVAAYPAYWIQAKVARLRMHPEASKS